MHVSIDCEEDFYGENCMLPCSSGCDGKCDVATGRCSPCKPGWTGQSCFTSMSNKSLAVYKKRYCYINFCF